MLPVRAIAYTAAAMSAASCAPRNPCGEPFDPSTCFRGFVRSTDEAVCVARARSETWYAERDWALGCDLAAIANSDGSFLVHTRDLEDPCAGTTSPAISTQAVGVVIESDGGIEDLVHLSTVVDCSKP